MTGRSCRLQMTKSVCVCEWNKRKRRTASHSRYRGRLSGAISYVPSDYLSLDRWCDCLVSLSRWCDKTGRESEREGWNAMLDNKQGKKNERCDRQRGAKVWVRGGGWKTETKEREISKKERWQRKWERKREREQKVLPWGVVSLSALCAGKPTTVS